MKTNHFFALTFLLFLFTSCTKINRDDSNANQGGNAFFTLAGAPNNCEGVAVLGNYTANVQADGTNTVSLTVNVTKTGNWNITTARLNGLRFSGVGSFTATGNQTISLVASGKPLLPGSYNFSAGNLPCSFQVNVNPDNSNLDAASFTFKSAADTCANPAIFGSYQLGQEMDTSLNYVTLLADVTKPGTYNISTNYTNGIRFKAQGSFTSVGPNQPVVFRATGFPIFSGKGNFKTGDKPTDCVFTINIASPQTVATGTIKATIDGVPVQFNEQLHLVKSVQSGINQVFFFGQQSVPGVSNDVFYLGFRNNTGPVVPGVYPGLTTNPAPNIFSQVTYVTGADNYHNTRIELPAQNILGITLTTFTAAEATGSFSGKLYKFRGTGLDSVTVTNGTFDLHF